MTDRYRTAISFGWRYAGKKETDKETKEMEIVNQEWITSGTTGPSSRPVSLEMLILWSSGQKFENIKCQC